MGPGLAIRLVRSGGTCALTPPYSTSAMLT